MIRLNKLPKTVKRIKGSKDYADIDGSVYTQIRNQNGVCVGFRKKSPNLGRRNGYFYIPIYDESLKCCKTRRLNRVIAETFLPNPKNLPIVGHRNNIKTDNRVANLYWTTHAENVQKAVDDGLLVNDKGYQDSQSKPVVMFETKTNKELGRYGSICEAVRLTGLSKTTVARQARYKRPVRKPFYFRYQNDPSCF